MFNTFGGGIHRSQGFFQFFGIGLNEFEFGVHHFQPPLTRANFTETTQFIAGRHHIALQCAEVKKAQGNGASAVTEFHHQHALFTVLNICRHDLTQNADVGKRPAITNGVDARAIFVAGWQMKQHILHGV